MYVMSSINSDLGILNLIVQQLIIEPHLNWINYCTGSHQILSACMTEMLDGNCFKVQSGISS